MEPEQFIRGKLFHKKVQTDWGGLIANKPMRPEFHVPRGRIDVFVDQIEDFVTIIEIKSTDWDKIKPQNIRKLLSSHSRQVFRYIDKFLDVDKVNVCAAIIYPKAPDSNELKDFIEKYFADNSFQLVWYDEKSNTAS